MNGNELTASETAVDLTGFRRDVLAVLDVADGKELSGMEIVGELEPHYGSISPGRIYPNLDTLVDEGLVERRAVSRRTNGYRLTAEGEAALRSNPWFEPREGESLP